MEIKSYTTFVYLSAMYVGTVICSETTSEKVRNKQIPSKSEAGKLKHANFAITKE